MDIEETLGYREAAALLGIAPQTLRTWVMNREIPHVRVGRRRVRFLRQDLQQFLVSSRIVTGQRTDRAG